MVQAPLKRHVRTRTGALACGVLLLWLATARPAVAQSMRGHETASGQASAVAASVHVGLSCRSCHVGESAERGAVPDSVASCASCHAIQASTSLRDAHAAARAAGRVAAPTCVSCHGSHSVRPVTDPRALTHRANVAGQCSSCHVRAVREYLGGVHATRTLATNGAPAATCTDCHAAHDARGGDVGMSAVGRYRVATTCARCHEESQAAYAKSVHASAVQLGNPHAATCVSCHGGHDTEAVRGSEATAAALRRSAQDCASCHGDIRLAGDHGFTAAVVSDYRGSFHGLAAAIGDRRVANCASCHGNHDIRSAADSGARTHPANVGATCGSCHVGATATFAAGGIHHTPTTAGHRLVESVRAMYVMLIAALLTLMALHNVADWQRAWRDRRRRVAAEPAAMPHAADYLRFTRNERLQHWWLVASFVVLVLSGFALRFGWTLPVLGPSMGALLRAWAHRTAALALLAGGLYHLGYLALTVRGRALIGALLPRLRRVRDALCLAGCCLRLGPPSVPDWKELIQTLRYNIGVTDVRPRVGRFSYAEKMEYFALVWGTVVMAATGLVLWLEVPFLNRFPFWAFQVASVVHLYEAILATLAIVVWHFYFVMLRPDVFPLSKVMCTGRLSRDQMEHEHPRELEELEAAKSQRPDAGAVQT